MWLSQPVRWTHGFWCPGHMCVARFPDSVFPLVRRRPTVCIVTLLSQKDTMCVSERIKTRVRMLPQTIFLFAGRESILDWMSLEFDAAPARKRC